MALRHQVVWERCAVPKPGTDEEVILKRGELLPEWTSDFTKFVLTGCGAVKAVEQLDPALTAAPAGPLLLPEHPLPPVIDRTGMTPAPGPQPQTGTTAAEAPAKPKANASKNDWVAYAVSVRPDGMSEEDAKASAEAKTRDELAAAFADAA